VHRIRQIATGAVSVFAVALASAQGYPEKPIRLLMPFPPGGASENVARPATQKLGAALGRPIVLDARPGASGVIAAELASKSQPDGYTLLFATSALFSILPAMTAVPYEPTRGFAPITRFVSLTNALIVHPSLPVRTVADLISYAKQNPDKLSYASAGNGTTFHIAGELFKLMAGVKMTHVPYKGGAPAQIDVIAGQVPLMFDSLSSALVPIRSARVRVLAVSTRQRSPVLPDVPTVAEAGLPGFEVSGWFGVVAPAKTPRGIVKRLNAELRSVLASSDIHERLTSQGYLVATMSPDEFAAFIASELRKWTKIVKDTGVRVD
jgi:tripartite-type tricarboxylate transporter receptor subunit TctC